MKETNVVLVKKTDIVYVVLEHQNSLNAHTECEAAVFLGVDTAVAEHVGVNHTCAEDLDPALALAKTATLSTASKAAYVNLCRGLCEGEVVGAESGSCVFAEHSLSEAFKSALKVAHSDALVNHKTLELMEEGRVSCVNRVTSVNTSGRDNSYRRLLLLHRTYLNGRRL